MTPGAGMRNILFGLLWVAGLLAPACAMEVKSADIREGQKLARDQVYRNCGGLNISPQLSWSAGPEGTVGYAITMIDIDAKPAGWVHWALVNIPAHQTFIPRSAPRIPGARAINNDFGNPAYDGPCPPRGSGPHRYRITVWALKSPAPDFAPGATAEDIVAALAKIALDKASLTGHWER